MKFEWDRDDIYISNNGKGPMKARIVCATDKEVTMERWRQGNGRRTRFILPIWFLKSPKCGWVLRSQ